MQPEKESLSSRSTRTFSTLTIGRVLALLIGIANVVVVARLLGPQLYGVFTVAFAFFALMTSASNFGFGQYLVKHLSQAEDNDDAKAFSKALGSSYFSVIVIGLLLTLFAMGISGLVQGFENGTGVTLPLLVTASATIFFSMLYGTSDSALIGIGKNAAAIALENIRYIVAIAVSVALILMGYGVLGAIAGVFVSYAFSAALGTYLVFAQAQRRMHVGALWPRPKDLRESLGFSLPIAGNNLLTGSMTSIATLVLGFFISADLLGNFGVATRARNTLAVFYTTAAFSILPTLSIAATRKAGTKGRSLEEVYNKTMEYAMLSGTPIIAYIGVFAAPLVYLLLSTSYASAPLYLSLVSLGTIVGLVGTLATSIFVATNNTSKLLSYAAAATAIQLAALAALIPSFGVIGAIVAVFFIGSLAYDYLFLRGVRVALKMHTQYRRLAVVLLSNAALALVFAAGLLLHNSLAELVYGVVALALAYPVFLVAFGIIGREEITMLGDASGHMPAMKRLAKPALAYFSFLDRSMHHASRTIQV